MKEHPILFSAPMVRAILAGTKTQTRRVVKAKHLPWLDNSAMNFLDGKWNQRPLPYGQPGDRLWVRETWAAPHAYDHLPPRLTPQDARIHYAASEERGGLLWRPSIHMPRWASRITLKVTGVRAERLQDISEADAVAEGIERVTVKTGATVYPFGSQYSHDSVAAYSHLWESINGPGSWEANPWVWVIEFLPRVEGNHQ